MKPAVLLTGVTGFLGGYLAKDLLSRGYQVIALSRGRRETKLLEGIMDEIIWHEDGGNLNKIFSAHQIDSVIHNAACYGRNGELPDELMSVNVNLSLRLFHTAQNAGVRVFINTGTSLPRGTSPYALSKQQFVDWCKLLSGSACTQVVNVRLEHMYGPFDDDSKLITWLIHQCLKGVDSLPLTEGGQLRDFIYVDDVCAAYAALLEASLDTVFSEIELGSGEAISIKSLAKMIKRSCQSQTRLHFGAVPYRDNEAMYTKADTTYLKSLGWACETALEDGIKKTIEVEKHA